MSEHWYMSPLCQNALPKIWLSESWYKVNLALKNLLSWTVNRIPTKAWIKKDFMFAKWTVPNWWLAIRGRPDFIPKHYIVPSCGSKIISAKWYAICISYLLLISALIAALVDLCHIFHVAHVLFKTWCHIIIWVYKVLAGKAVSRPFHLLWLPISHRRPSWPSSMTILRSRLFS